MAKRLTRNNGAAQADVIGLDIGYGVTKAVAPGTVAIFPSVCAPSREIKFQAGEIAARYPGEQLADDEGEWFIGDLAMSQAVEGELIRLRGRGANEALLGNIFRLRLAKAAIGKLYPGLHAGEVVHIRLATGLPVNHMRGAAELKAALVGQHIIQTDAAHFVANITEVMVMPQPYGTIYSKMLTARGELDPCHTAKRTGVIDIGTYTVDLALDDDGEYIESRSGSIEAGVWLAQSRLAEAIERDFNQRPNYKTIEAVLRTGCIKRGRETFDYREIVGEAVAPIQNAVLAFIQEKWLSGLELDVAYIAGGGAALCAPQITQAYPQATLLENAAIANAQGYLNYALYKSV